MEVKGEGKKCKVVECAMRRCVSVRERVYACEKQLPVVSVERDLDFPLKRETECAYRKDIMTKGQKVK